jgi:ABC-type bacteriocin/lantibiotic exporter with double-glycine peptidase domain
MEPDTGDKPALLQARESFRVIGHGARSFFQLLVRTLSTLPGDVVAASIVINFLGLALPLGILQVYDRIIPNSATATLAMFGIGIGIALVVETILRIVRGRVLAWSAMQVAWQSNIDAACRIATAPAEVVDAQPAARWFQRLQAVVTISDFGMSQAPLLLVDMVFIVIFLPLLLASSGWLAAVPLVVFVLFGVAAIERGHAMREITAKRAVAETKVRDFLVEALNDIVTVKALGTEQQILRRFERLYEQSAGYTYRTVRLIDDAQSLASLVSILTQVATATVGAILAINGQISIGVAACSTMLAGRNSTLLRVVTAWNEIQGAMVAEEIAKPTGRVRRRVPRPQSSKTTAAVVDHRNAVVRGSVSTTSRCSAMPISSRRRVRRHARSASKPTSICCRADTTRA